MRYFICALLLALSTFALPQKQPKYQVNVWVAKNVAPSSKIRLNINTKNAPIVNVAAYRIDGEDWLRRHHAENARPPISGKPAQRWTVTVAEKGQGPNPNHADTFYSKQINLPKMSPGVYCLVVGAQGVETKAVVNVTNLAVVVKRSPTKMLVWVTDAVLGKVVPRARINVYSYAGSFQRTLQTGADGAILTEAKPGTEILVVGRGNDLAGLDSGAPNPDGELKAHFQTDRPIYRPGQTIYFKSILRRTLGQVYKPVANTRVKVQLRDPKDNPVDELELTSNGIGSINGQFDIPSEGATGAYTLVLSIGEESAYQTLTVAEYRKPEFKVDIKAGARRYLAGEKISFIVDAAYYFGAPVQQASVRYQVRRSGMSFWSYDSNESWFYGGDGNMYARDTYDANPFVAEDTAYTDTAGHLVIIVPADKAAPDSNYSITLTVEDSSRRQVQGSASVPVYAAAVRIGVQPQYSYSTLGSLIPVIVQTRDLDGKPVPAKVLLEMTKQVLDEKKQQYHEVVMVSTTVQVPASGNLTYSLPAREEGSFTIRATTKDSGGRVAKSSTSIWVYGNFKPREKVAPAPSVDVQLDRRVYKPGDVAKALVITNNPGLPLLVTIEGGDLWQYHVINAPKGAQTYPITAATTMSPNAYVSAEQWVKGQLVSAEQILPVPDPARALTVEVAADKQEYRPGDTATYTVRTLTKSGKPVSAEVALSVVDEAIFALSPDNTTDLYRFYWGQRENRVSTYETAPEEMSGGAYQRVNTVAPLRQRFEDTAYWNATVTTDASGMATVKFEVPGNLTSWRATARGVTADTSVGMARSNVLANRPMMLRLATPRQLVQSDKLTLIGTIDNRSASDHEVEVSLSAEGIGLLGDTKQRLTVPAKGQKKVEWRIDASKLPESGRATFVGQVVALDVPEGPARVDVSDALQVLTPVVPAGIQERVVVGGTLSDKTTATLVMPADRIEPASKVRIEISAGVQAVGTQAAADVVAGGRYSTVSAANQLIAASILGLKNKDDAVKESIAMLSRTQQPQGWGWWENAPADPVITARVLWALTMARNSGITVYQNMFSAAQRGAEERYAQTNLWDHRAQLAAALLFSKAEGSKDHVEEVLRRGEKMSPFARLRLANAMASAGLEGAADLLNDTMKDASTGPSQSFLPAGSGIGWTATSTETTAEAVVVMNRLRRDDAEQARMARWLMVPENGWRSQDEQTAVAYALYTYGKDHPDAKQVGDVQITVNGTAVTTTRAKIGDIVLATIPAGLLKTGDNAIAMSRTEGGQTFFSVDATVYRPHFTETAKGVRVMRRFEVRSDAGVWVELRGDLRPNEPVRCTVVVWGDDIPDALRVVEPIPAGFEYIESQPSHWGREEVRDGAVVHYLVNSGAPQVFRYYLRAETEGNLTVIPAQAEYVRRPSDRGHSNGDRVVVKLAR